MSIDLPTDIDQRLGAARHTVLRRVRRRRRLTAGATIAGVLIAAGSGVGATLAVQRMNAYGIANSVECYLHDDLGSFHSGAVQAQVAPDADGSRPSQAPANKREMCQLVWRSGLAVEAAGGHPKVDPYSGIGDYAVPWLAFCVLQDGSTGGFPIEAPSTTGTQVCDRLGLAVDRTVPTS